MRRLLFLCAPLLVACIADGSGERLGTAQEANVCPAGTTLEGVDVSVYDGTVDWTQLKASGRAFGIAKATEGATFKDAQFATNWAAMKSAGIVRSAYHYFHCDADPTTQATHFLSVLGTLEPGDLPPSLDFEDTTTCTASTGISMAVEWLDAVAKATGTLPLIYTSVNVLSSFSNTQALAGHAQLWVASRGVTCPNLPAPFTAWSFWQYSLTGTAPGLPNSNGMADLDRFNGDMSALLALTVGGSSSSTSSASSTSGGPSCVVGGVVGTCIDTSVCAAMPGYVSTPGLCPGPVSEQCCTPTGSASSASSSSSGSTSTSSSSSSSGAGGASNASSSAAGTGGGSAGGVGATGGVGGAGASSGGQTSNQSSSCAVTQAGTTTSIPGLSAALLSAWTVMSLRRPRRRGRAPRMGGKT